MTIDEKKNAEIAKYLNRRPRRCHAAMNAMADLLDIEDKP